MMRTPHQPPRLSAAGLRRPPAALEMAKCWERRKCAGCTEAGGRLEAAGYRGNMIFSIPDTDVADAENE